MKTLRGQLNHLLRPESCAGEYTMYEAAKMALVAKQMDALLEECVKKIERNNTALKELNAALISLKQARYGATLGITVEGE